MTRSGAGSAGQLLAPRSVALVGASERSKWATIIESALSRGGYAGRVELVNGRGGEVFGRMRSLAWSIWTSRSIWRT